MADRKMIDCRKLPSETDCSLTVMGPEEDLLDAAVDHAVNKHGHERSPELREQLRSMLEDAPAGV